MKKLCFGTLLNLIYQAKGQNVNYTKICAAVFSVYGCNNHRDKSLPAQLKSGKANVPPDVIDAAREIGYDEAVAGFEKHVVSLIKEQKLFIHAVKAVLRGDNITGDTQLGYGPKFAKQSILNCDRFVMASLLAALFRFAIVEVSNSECESFLKDFEGNYLTTVDASEIIFIDPLNPDAEDEDGEESTPLQITLEDKTFDRVFRKVAALNVTDFTQASTANIYCADLNNGKLRFNKVKEYLLENIGSYVFSRTKLKSLQERTSSAVGAHAMREFKKAYGANADSVLGELMLYIFLEQELHAPKIMSKVEFSQPGAMVSKSDGIHLLPATERGSHFNQLVFGASNIEGDLKLAVDRAMDRVESIRNNEDNEYRTVEHTSFYGDFDSRTREYLRDILIPRKHPSRRPDLAYGLFLGYTLKVDPPVFDSALYRAKAAEQLKQDVEAICAYIKDSIIDRGLAGYTFYCYILPFNDAPVEKTSLIDEMLEGC